MALTETLRPASVGEIKIVRGSDNTFVFTVLENGLPKDMSPYAGFPPKIRFLDKPLSSNGVTTGFAQALDVGTTNGVCEWLNGGSGGQIHILIPRLDFGDGTKGTENAVANPDSGVFDIEIKSVEDHSSMGGPSNVNNVQRAIRGEWRIDREVTLI